VPEKELLVMSSLVCWFNSHQTFFNLPAFLETLLEN
jgi:hypothetical protein